MVFAARVHVDIYIREEAIRRWLLSRSHPLSSPSRSLVRQVIVDSQAHAFELRVTPPQGTLPLPPAVQGHCPLTHKEH